jgi:hypothetical protein
MVRKPTPNPAEAGAPDRESPAMASLSAPSEQPLRFAAASPEPNRGGRPRKTQGRDQLIEIIARVARGETLTAIAKTPGMPSPPAFRAAIAKDVELSRLWMEAKEERPHALFDEAIDMARELRETKWDKNAGNQVRALQVAIDALRTAAGRLKPREYGERPASSVVVPVQIITSLGLEPGVLPPKEVNQYAYDINIEPSDG